MPWRTFPGRWPTAVLALALFVVAPAGNPRHIHQGGSLFGSHRGAVVNADDGGLEVERRATRGSRGNPEPSWCRPPGVMGGRPATSRYPRGGVVRTAGAAWNGCKPPLP